MIEIKKNKKLGKAKVRALKIVWAHKGEIYTLYKLGTAREVYDYFIGDNCFFNYKSVPFDVELNMREEGMIVAFVKWTTPIEAIQAWCEDTTKHINLI